MIFVTCPEYFAIWGSRIAFNLCRYFWLSGSGNVGMSIANFIAESLLLYVWQMWPYLDPSLRRYVYTFRRCLPCLLIRDCVGTSDEVLSLTSHCSYMSSI